MQALPLPPRTIPSGIGVVNRFVMHIANEKSCAMRHLAASTNVQMHMENLVHRVIEKHGACEKKCDTRGIVALRFPNQREDDIEKRDSENPCPEKFSQAYWQANCRPTSAK